MGGIVTWDHPIFSSDLTNSFWDWPSVRQIFSRNYETLLLKDKPECSDPYWVRSEQQPPSTPEVVNTETEFRVTLDVSQFLPEELEVKTTEKRGRLLLIEGKQRVTTEKHQLICRKFSRKYIIPENTEIESILSTVSQNGVLTVTAKKSAMPHEAT